MADFLIALADFDRRRGWEALGHASLFAFLYVELRLSNSAAFYRKSAAQLLQRFPLLIEPLGDGRLCLSTTAELSKVLTDENRAQVAPRFFGLSAREAQELVAELQPQQAPATRMMVTKVESPSAPSRSALAEPLQFRAQPLLSLATGQQTHPNVVPLSRVLTSDFANGGGERTHTPRDEAEPLSADLRRLHVTVSRQLLKKLEAAQTGLGHAIPGATMEQVIEAALDLLLEKHARARGQVKRPRKTFAANPTEAQAEAPSHQPAPTETQAEALSHQPAPTAPPTPAPSSPQTSSPGASEPPTAAEPPPHRRSGHREAIPAAVKRAVWARDQGRCSWPIDGGGVCGSTHRLELDHVVPWAKWSDPTAANLPLTCAHHNRLAARQALGERQMARYRTW